MEPHEDERMLRVLSPVGEKAGSALFWTGNGRVSQIYRSDAHQATRRTQWDAKQTTTILSLYLILLNLQLPLFIM